MQAMLPGGFPFSPFNLLAVIMCKYTIECYIMSYKTQYHPTIAFNICIAFTIFVLCCFHEVRLQKRKIKIMNEQDLKPGVSVYRKC